MAIAKTKKITVLGYRADRREIIGWLQRAGAVEILDLPGPEAPSEYEGLSRERAPGAHPPDAAGKALCLKEMERTINLLSGWEKKPGLLEGLVGTRPELSHEELARQAGGFDFRETCREAAHAEQRRKRARARKERLAAELLKLEPWLPLGGMPLGEAADTKKTRVLLGRLEEPDGGVLEEDLKRETKFYYLKKINARPGEIFLLVVYLREEEEKVGRRLRESNFQPQRFPELEPGRKEPVGQIIKNIKRTRERLEIEERGIEDELRKMARRKPALMAVHDWLLNDLAREGIVDRFLRSRQTFLLAGWVKKEEGERLRREGRDRFPGAEVILSDPREGETPPVILENVPSVRAFEMITGLYGLPHAREFDPTPLFAPFFTLFFGICVSDAGYGLAILGGGWLLARKSRAGKKIFPLLLTLGISTLVIGVLTGSWFGNAYELLPERLSFLRAAGERLRLLDPMKDMFVFMGLALSLGMAQVLFGMILKLIRLGQQRDRIGILLQIAWLILVVVMVPLLGKAVFGLRLEGAWFFLTKWSALASAGFIFLFSGRAVKNVFARLGLGLYGLYAITEYFSHVLSYLRLFALGLSSSLLALSLNWIVESVAGIPVFGPLLAVVLFVGGHAFCLLINILGGFIHSVRLQFLEFFSKFFEGGGRGLRPFKTETKYVALKD